MQKAMKNKGKMQEIVNMRYKELGSKIGAMVDEKNKAYGNSYNESSILKVSR